MKKKFYEYLDKLKKVLITFAWKKIAIISLSIFIAIAIDYVVRSVEENWLRKTSFSFSLPFPDDIEEKYGLQGVSQNLEVEKVCLAGDFNSWSPSDVKYEMKQSGENR